MRIESAVLSLTFWRKLLFKNGRTSEHLHSTTQSFRASREAERGVKTRSRATAGLTWESTNAQLSEREHMTRKHGEAVGIEQRPTHTDLYTNKMAGNHSKPITLIRLHNCVFSFRYNGCTVLEFKGTIQGSYSDSSVLNHPPRLQFNYCSV